MESPTRNLSRTNLQRGISRKMNEEPLWGISSEKTIGTNLQPGILSPTRTNLQPGIYRKMNEESFRERISNQESLVKWTKNLSANESPTRNLSENERRSFRERISRKMNEESIFERISNEESNLQRITNEESLGQKWTMVTTSVSQKKREKDTGWERLRSVLGSVIFFFQGNG